MTNRSKCKSAKFGLMTGVLLAFSSSTALGQAVVFESTVTGIQRGRELGEDETVNVPNGARLVVGVVRDGGITLFEIRGPQSKTIKELTKPAPPSMHLDVFERERAYKEYCQQSPASEFCQNRGIPAK
jgi:hypothetical protein